MMKLASDALSAMGGKTLATAESCTGGGIGSLLTAVPGASAVYKGGVISYTDEVKQEILGVDPYILERYGAVSLWTAGAMASGVRKLLKANFAVSVTGLAGPGGDEFGHDVGTVFIGLSWEGGETVLRPDPRYMKTREQVRQKAASHAFDLVRRFVLNL